MCYTNKIKIFFLTGIAKKIILTKSKIKTVSKVNFIDSTSAFDCVTSKTYLWSKIVLVFIQFNLLVSSWSFIGFSPWSRRKRFFCHFICHGIIIYHLKTMLNDLIITKKTFQTMAKIKKIFSCPPLFTYLIWREKQTTSRHLKDLLEFFYDFLRNRLYIMLVFFNDETIRK